MVSSLVDKFRCGMRQLLRDALSLTNPRISFARSLAIALLLQTCKL
jgi:hypothetical protein